MDGILEFLNGGVLAQVGYLLLAVLAVIWVAGMVWSARFQRASTRPTLRRAALIVFWPALWLALTAYRRG